MEKEKIKYDKLMDEIYGLLVMDLLYPKMVERVRKNERPDWKDDADLYGIEVTRAETKHIGYTNNKMGSYLGRKIEEIPRKELEQFDGATVFVKGKLKAVSPTKGPIPGNTHVMYLLEHLKKKLQLLNHLDAEDKPKKSDTPFTVCTHNYLFEFSTGIFSDQDKLDFGQGIREITAHYQYIFEEIIVADRGNSVLCFSTDGTCKEHSVSPGDLTRLAWEYHKVMGKKEKPLFCDLQKDIGFLAKEA